MSETYLPSEGYSLWGENGVSVHDIRQGQIGDCWFLTAASAMVEVPGRLESVFVSEETNSTNGISHNGIYAINMYALMMPVTITIDDRIPLRKGTDRTLYANIGKDKSVWGPLFEKAFAKYHGSYEALVAGNPMIALNTISGSPGHSFNHDNYRIMELWAILTE